MSLDMAKHHVLARHTVNSPGAQASDDRNCPMYRDERAIQERRFKEGLSFLDAQREFLETKLKTRTQCCASTLHHPRGVDTITQTVAIPSKTKHSCSPMGPSQITVSGQTKVSRQMIPPTFQCLVE
jgi:hypothetical protein